MAYPAAPTESGGAKIIFLTTDGNVAAGYFAVTEGVTATGSNTVGFKGIATHVEGDAVAAPGGLNTTASDVPVVLVAGDDGTNAVPLQLSGTDLKITLDSEAVVLGAGTAEIGKLAAGVAEIGNVKNAGTFVVQVDGAALTSLQLIDDVIFVDDTATHTAATTKVAGIGAVATPTDAAIDANDIGMVAMSLDRRLHVDSDIVAQSVGDLKITLDSEAVVLGAGSAAIGKLAANSGVDIGDVDILSIAAGDNNIGNVDIVTVLTGSDALNLGKIEDGPHSSGDLGVMALAIRDDALAADAGVGADLDYVPLRTNNDGALWVQPSAGNLGGCKMFTSVDLDESEEDIATGPCTVFGIYAWNATAAPLWLQIFNTNTVTVGTTAPTHNFIVPANADSDGAGVVIPIPVQGAAFDTALTMAMTTGVGTDNGAPGANAGGVFVAYQD